MENIFHAFFFSCGPIFGAGADFLISNNCNSNLDSYSNLPHSYDGPNASFKSLLGDYYSSVVDYEVYTVAAAAAQPLSGSVKVQKQERF